ncbi:PHP domain-containing protein [Erysipelothrix urinaevulpis]|uniref:PHP domain-containing protein n=1 Tax=Erysipelothrix urinaevulpis TaxID=2683717 RepID=UPI00135A08BF|nr:PHP domain-containing protein [Erysipelothrix urinaevulpis]
MTTTSRNIDLHMHSNCSLDGDFTPEELINLCKKSDLKTVSLADHNSVEGVERMIIAADKSSIRVIPAIEIDCVYKETNLHILGYNIDYKDDRFNQLGRDLLSQERKGVQTRIQRLEELGIYINHALLKTLMIDGVATGEMIAEASIHEPENINNKLLAPYKKAGHRSDNPYVNFYWDYCAQGKPAYIPIKLPSLKEIITMIHASGGIAIFAHPGHNIHENPKLLKEIMEEGLDGLEAYSSYHSLQQIQFYESYAMSHHKLVTCGSDFHGKIKPAIKLGEIDYPLEHYHAFLNTLLE